ncbi:hypothetical protein [Tabrizicola fusiformis]|uniref:hypothetical protein n=1 Tax=Tabrizicola sp. SY72 TaxID=2741673 RepID=UPI00157317B1|nr:hypothetical protein [Tabrizicola sp. SY72]NTT88247.1 hypothetical protein [Tabrizicola sp. SY72]
MIIDLELEEVARRFPLDQRVRYFPIAGEIDFVTTAIRSKTWRLGHGAIVIKIVGRSGGVHVGHLEAIA